MSQQTTRDLTKRAIDLRPPLPTVRFGQWYLVDEGTPSERFITGYDLCAQKAPVRISAIAWRV